MFQGKGNLTYVKAVNVRGRREHNGVISEGMEERENGGERGRGGECHGILLAQRVRRH